MDGEEMDVQQQMWNRAINDVSDLKEWRGATDKEISGLKIADMEQRHAIEILGEKVTTINKALTDIKEDTRWLRRALIGGVIGIIVSIIGSVTAGIFVYIITN